MANRFLFAFLFLCGLVQAQQDSIALREVVVSDAWLQRYSRTQQVTSLQDSVVARSGVSLTDVLQYNTGIYFKQNGYGMVSSPSFRGTTAQQTAVVWNGININSQLNGQTDFNTVSANTYDNISVRSGGGSSLYGSSAIGGSIHLDDVLRFGQMMRNEITLGYGSFDTYQARYRLSADTHAFADKAGVSHNRSQNDYRYLGVQDRQFNVNGQFQNTNFDVAAAYRMGEHHLLKFYGQTFDGDRHFSGTTSMVGKGRYLDLNTRNLLEWDALVGAFTSKVKLAALTEKYRYFENAASDISSGAHTQTHFARYDAGLKIKNNWNVNAVADYTQTIGAGSDIDRSRREIVSFSGMAGGRIYRTLYGEASLRKEITANYQSPLLYATGLRWDATKSYRIKANFSRNFRIPTFNDLYWNGAGNRELQPESAYQYEVGQELKWRAFLLSATAYRIELTDMLRWTPGANGIWRPENVAKARTQGVDASLGCQHTSGRQSIEANAQYSYVQSTDLTLDKQMIYVPFHKGAASIAYRLGRFGMWYQLLYNGMVYTSSDNAEILESYVLSNAGIDCSLGNKRQYKIGALSRNLSNQPYQSVAKRPMPGRYFQLQLNLIL